MRALTKLKHGLDLILQVRNKIGPAQVIDRAIDEFPDCGIDKHPRRPERRTHLRKHRRNRFGVSHIGLNGKCDPAVEFYFPDHIESPVRAAKIIDSNSKPPFCQGPSNLRTHTS